MIGLLKAFLVGLLSMSTCMVFGQIDLKNKAVRHSIVLPTHQLTYPLLTAKNTSQQSVLITGRTNLPKNLHESTAFFCRIEDAIAKNNGVNFKFRLGSVDYVDAMEGKGYFQAVSYSRASNFSMQFRKQK